jgi:hypothetical protein
LGPIRSAKRDRNNGTRAHTALTRFDWAQQNSFSSKETYCVGIDDKANIF